MTKPTDPRLQALPEDALNYNDDVTAETVAKIREEDGVDLSSGEWGMRPDKHLAAENAALRAGVEKLRPWARLGVAVMQGWPDAFGDLDGFELQEMAVAAGVLQEVPGGYDPDQHADIVGVCPERGDPWFERISVPRAALGKGLSDD